MEADVKLLFGVLGGGSVSDGSGKEIAKDIARIVYQLEKSSVTKIKFSPDEASAKKMRSTIQSYIDEGNRKKQFVVTVSKIDTSQALNGLKKDLEKVVQSISIKNGVDIKVNTKAFGEVASDAGTVKTNIDQATKVISQFNAQMRVLNATQKSTSKAFETVLSNSSNISSKSGIAKLRAEYQSLMSKIEEIRQSKRVLSDEEMAEIDKARAAIERKTKKYLQAAQQEKQAAMDAARTKKNAAKEVEDAEKKAAEEQEKAAKKEQAALSKAINLRNQIVKYRDSNTKLSGSVFGNNLDSLVAQLDKFVSGTEDLDNINLNQISQQFKKLTGDIYATGAGGKNLLTILKEGYIKFGGWSIVTRSLSSAWRSAQKMLDVIIDIDTAMTELRKVTNETEQAYNGFLTSATARARQLGATIVDTVSSTADFARLGYSLEQASSLADAAIIYKNVGDGIEDIGDASESIISTIKAFEKFGISAENAMLVVDKFNEVGNNFAISSKGIGDALLNSAAALAAAGNSLDESIALITTANEVIQNPEKVGTTLKTVSMFLRAAKTEAEEAGESTGGMANSVSELRSEILALTGGEVDIQIDENTFKNSYQIIKDLSEVWGKLTDISRANILEMVGGKRNANVVAALIENFNTAEKVMQKSADAAGSATAENEKYLDSINGRISQFKASFEALSQTIINSDLVKWVVDAGTSVLDILTKITDALGAVPTLAATAGAALSAMNVKSFLSSQTIRYDSAGSNIFSSFSLKSQNTIDTEGIIEFAKAIDGLEEGSEKFSVAYNKYMANVTSSARAFADQNILLHDVIDNTTGDTKRIYDSSILASSGFDKVSSSLKTMKVGMVAAKAATIALNSVLSFGIGVALQFAVQQIVEWAQNNERLAENVLSAAEKYNKATDNLALYSNKIDELKDKLRDDSISHEEAYNARRQLLEIQGEIASAYNIEANQLDLLTMSAEAANEALNSIGRQMAGDQLTKNATAIENAIKAIEKEQAFDNFNFKFDKNERNSTYGKKLLDILERHGAYNVNDASNESYTVWIQGNALEAKEQVNSLAAELRALDTEMRKSGQSVDDFLGSGNTFSSLLEKSLEKINKVLEKNDNLSVYEQATTWKIAENSEYYKLQSDIVTLQEKYNDALATTYNSESEQSAVLAEIIGKYTEIAALVGDDTFFGTDDYGVQRYFEKQIATLKAFSEKYEAQSKLDGVFNKYLSEIAKAERLGEGDIIDGEFVPSTEASIAAQEEFIRVARLAGMTEEGITLALKDGAIAFFEQADAVNKAEEEILSLVGAIGELSTIQENVDNLSAALGEFSENKDISVSTLNELTEVFGNLESFDDLVTVLTNQNSTYDDVHKALNSLGEEYVESTDIIKKLNDENKDAIATYLEEIGVVNAREVVEDQLIKKKLQEAIATGELTGATREEIAAFLQAAGASDILIQKIANIDAIQYEALRSTTDFTEANTELIGRLIQTAKAAGLAAENIELFKMAETLAYKKEHGTLDDWQKENYDYIMNLVKQITEVDLDKLLEVDIPEVNVNLPDNAKTAAEKFEEYLSELNEEFSKVITNYEHNIFLGEKNGADYTALIAIYKEMQEAVHAQAEKYRALGVDENSDYIQALQKQWWEYEDSITQLREDHFEELSNSIQEVVDKANEALDGFQDFYSAITDAAKEYASTGYLSADSLQSVLELGPKYLTFLQDENGQLVLNEEALQNVIAAKTEEMAVETAMAFAKNVLIAAQNDDIKTLEELTQVNIAATNSTWDMVYATLELAKATGIAKGHSAAYYDDALREARNIQALAKTTVSSIQEYYKTLNEGYVSQADGLQTILEMTQEMIQWENDQKIETLEKEKELFGDIVDAQRESLELAKEQDDHNKSVAEKLEKIARLQDNIDMLKLDDSREASAQRSQLEQELNELQKELADEQADYAYELQVDTLEKQQQAFEDSKDEEIEALESTLDSAEELYQAAIKRIDAGWDDLYKDLLDWNYEYGSTLEKDLVTAWDAATAAVQRYGSFVEALEGVQSYTNLGSGYADGSGVSSGVAMTDQMTDIYNKMKQNSFDWFLAGDKSKQADLSSENVGLAKDWEALTGQALTPKDFSWYMSDGSLFYSLDKNDVAKAVVSEMESNAAKWKIADQQGDSAKKNILSAKNSQMAADLAYYLNRKIENIGGTWYIDGRPLFDEFDRYHTGGIVGGKGTLKQNEVMAVLEEGEIILDEGKEKVFYRFVDFAQMMSEKLGKAFDNVSFKNAFSGQNRMPALVGNAIPETTNNMNFNPIVNVNIQHSGNLDDGDAKRFGSIAANSVLSELTDAFSRRGISNMGSAFLK